MLRQSLASKAVLRLIGPTEELAGNPKCRLGWQHIRTFDQCQKVEDMGALYLGMGRSRDAVSAHGQSPGEFGE
jgi:hypothetical protein